MKMFAEKQPKAQKLWDKCIDQLLEDAVRNKDGDIIKDNRGVDYLFADHFWTQELEKDFPLTEQEFIKHCGEKLQKFNDAVWYEDSVFDREKPSKRLRSEDTNQISEWMNREKAPGTYKTADGKMLEDKDKVYFFTDYISHVTYGKFIAVVREKGIAFDYLGNTNMERLIKQIYDDMCEED